MKIFGQYRLAQKIAQGGMAEIFLATINGAEEFEKTVVIKRILPHLADEPEFVRMFIDEAKLAAQLTHPNIVQVLELGNVDGRYFIAMEYVQGNDLQTLRESLREQGESFPIAAVLAIAREVLAGLHYAHDKTGPDGTPLGLIHRDISPSNLLLSHEGLVKITDFGIAKAARSTARTRTGQIRGKLAYLSPEQASGLAVDQRADLFACALVLYELFANARVYTGEDEFALLAQTQRAQIEPLAAVVTGFPDALSRVMQQALARDREERFANGLAFSRALEAAAPGALHASELAVLVRQYARPLPALISTDPSVDAPPPSLAGATRVVGSERRSTRRLWGAVGVVACAALIALSAWWRRSVPAPAVAAQIAPASIPASLPAASPPAVPATVSATPPAIHRLATPRAFGFLTLNSQPWSEVWIDGVKQAETTPLDHVRLSEGAHDVRLVCPRLQRERSIKVRIDAGKVTTRVVEF